MIPYRVRAQRKHTKAKKQRKTELETCRIYNNLIQLLQDIERGEVVSIVSVWDESIREQSRELQCITYNGSSDSEAFARFGDEVTEAFQGKNKTWLGNKYGSIK